MPQNCYLAILHIFLNAKKDMDTNSFFLGNDKKCKK